MKILLSTPPFHPYQSYSLKFPRFPLLNISLLAATVREQHEVRILSHAARPFDQGMLAGEAETFRPDVVGLAVPSAVSAMALGGCVKNLKMRFPEIRIVMGGPFPTFEPGYCLEMGADAVFLGEADATFASWINCIEEDCEAACKMEGVAVHADPADRITEKNANVNEDLDNLPFPAWDLLPYRPVIYSGKKAAAIEMSRGCPYGCTFCTVHEFGKKYRTRSVKSVLGELAFLAGEGVGELLFVDNSFALEKERSIALIEGMREGGYAFEYGAYLRADTICESEDLIGKLAQSGLRYAIVGFESYTEDSLQTMHKSSDEKTNVRAANILKKADVFAIGSHIYGTPGESAADLRRTYRMGVKNSGLYKAGIYTPLPGSLLYAELSTKGLIDETDPLAMDYLHYHVGSKWQQRKIQLWAMLLFLFYHLHPRRLAKLFHPHRWTRLIFRAEYKTFAMRLIASAAWVFRKGN